MRQVTHALLTRPPLSHFSVRKLWSASFDLHVLSTPPAFILSQDQTLVKSVCSRSKSLASNFVTLLTVLRFDINCLFLNLFSRFELYMHSKASLSRSWGFAQCSLANLFENKFSSGFLRSPVLCFFRNFQEFVYCHLLFNYQCSLALLRQPS